MQSPRNGDDLSDGEPLETEERSHTPPPRMDSPEENMTPQLKIKVLIIWLSNFNVQFVMKRKCGLYIKQEVFLILMQMVLVIGK